MSQIKNFSWRIQLTSMHQQAPLWPLKVPNRSPLTVYQTFGTLSFEQENNRSPSRLNLICVIERSCPWSIIGFWKIETQTKLKTILNSLSNTKSESLENYEEPNKIVIAFCPAPISVAGHVWTIWLTYADLRPWSTKHPKYSHVPFGIDRHISCKREYKYDLLTIL